MTVALPERWIWDSWYAHDGEDWHCFFLQADKSLHDPELRHFNVSVGHAVSRDLHSWDHLGTCLRPSDGPSADDGTTWTGSVVVDTVGTWHKFYTGGSRAEDCLYQRIFHAVSQDLHSWQRVGDGACLDLVGRNSEFYETEHVIGHWHDRAMRDPWVMRDPLGQGWTMHFTARAPGIAEPNAGGAIGFATSPNLYDWTLQPPAFTGLFGQLEVPQVILFAGRWYCLFCCDGMHWSDAYRSSYPGPPVTGTHYLRADHPRGPWRVAPGAFLDGAMPCRRYASRILETLSGPVIMGFADGGRENFIGQIMDPEPVTIDSHGWLRVVTWEE